MNSTSTPWPTAQDLYALGHTCSIEIDRPQGAYVVHVSWPSQAAPAGGWPVVYMLDGETFPVIREILRYQVGAGAPGLPQPRVLVAIGFAGASRRAHDYTSFAAGAGKGQGGGAHAFRQWLTGSLRETVQSLAPIDSRSQTLMGHSLGAMFVLETLFDMPGAYATYVASSPSIWWSDGHLLSAAQRYVESGPASCAARVLISAAEYEQTLSAAELQMPAAEREALIHTRASRRMVDGNKELAGLLKRIAHWDVRFRMLDDETHRSAWPRAVAHALRLMA